jgi:hypothetical protein
VTVLEIIGTDKDGEPYAEPIEWDERMAGKPPLVVIEGSEAAPRKGDRVLAKIQPSKDGRYKFRARVIKVLSDRSATRCWASTACWQASAPASFRWTRRRATNCRC